MKLLLLIAAIILTIFALLVAAGNHFVTTWYVWMAAAWLAYFLALLPWEKVTTTRVVTTP